MDPTAYSGPTFGGWTLGQQPDGAAPPDGWSVTFGDFLAHTTQPVKGAVICT